jgi:hypothetical protein
MGRCENVFNVRDKKQWQWKTFLKPFLQICSHNLYNLAENFVNQYSDICIAALGSHLTPKSFVPFERDGKFIGREDILSKIHDLHEGKTRVALSGIGGVG